MSFVFQLVTKKQSHAFQFRVEYPSSAVEVLRSFGLTRDLSRKIIKGLEEDAAESIMLTTADTLIVRNEELF